jgi:hypothetical protein
MFYATERINQRRNFIECCRDDKIVMLANAKITIPTTERVTLLHTDSFGSAIAVLSSRRRSIGKENRGALPTTHRGHFHNLYHCCADGDLPGGCAESAQPFRCGLAAAGAGYSAGSGGGRFECAAFFWNNLAARSPGYGRGRRAAGCSIVRECTQYRCCDAATRECYDGCRVAYPRCGANGGARGRERRTGCADVQRCAYRHARAAATRC